MFATIKAEFRKLLTVRATYIVLLIVLALLVLAELYSAGYRSALSVADSGMVMNETFQAVNFTAVLISFAGLLLVTNEYRYNTITYTLTASKKRWRVFVAKALVITIFSALATLAICVLVTLFIRLGYALHGQSLATQTMYYKDLIIRSLFAGWAFSMMAYLLAMLVRSQVGAIAILFFWPGTLEGLLSLFLKDNSMYLPFTAIINVLQEGSPIGHGKSALIALVDIIIFGAITFYFFVKRDSN